MSTLKERKLKFETLQLHVGQEEPDPVTDARAVPIYQTSSYVFHNSKHAADRFGLRDAGNIYGRLTNPTEDIFEQRIAALEGGVAALAVGSGAAAVTYTIENLAQAGDHIVSAKNIYGGTYNLLAHTLVDFGVTTTFVDPFNLEEVEGAIKDNTKAVYIETLGNPNSEVVDIEALAEIAHKHKIPLVIDNTFGTPYLIRPIEYGADIVVHSATKFIGGHGTTIGGVIIDGGKFDWAASGKFPQLTEPNPSYHGVSFAAAAGPAAFVTRIRAILLRDTGATLSPIHAFIFLQGLETLSLRVERHVENALKVVEFLEKQPLVEKVNHPSVSEDPEQQRLYKKYFPNGGGSIFTFEIKGDDKKAQEFIDHLQLFSLLANVADVKSLVIHPASTTHAELNEQEQAEQGIKPNTIRLSIGTENIDDILYDLQEAFDANIPVFGCDSGFIEGMQVNATSDNYQMGQLITDYLFNDLMGGEGNVIALTHRPHPGVVKRCEAFDDAIAANDKISLITEQHIPAEQPINDAQDTVENLLLSNPEKGSITAIWCGWDEPAIGATQACMEAGRDEILVVGVDGNEQAVDLIKQGTNLKATVKQNFDGMADIVLEQMKLLYTGKEIEKGDMYADATLITQENAE